MLTAADICLICFTLQYLHLLLLFRSSNHFKTTLSFITIIVLCSGMQSLTLQFPHKMIYTIYSVFETDSEKDHFQMTIIIKFI